MSMLSGFRALDLTDEKGLLCGKVLGDLGVEVVANSVEVRLERAIGCDDFAETIPRFLDVLGGMVDVEDLLALVKVEVHPETVDEVDRVPVRVVVSGGDRDCARGAVSAHEELDYRCRADAEIDDGASCGHQSTGYGLLEHSARCTCIHSEQDFAAIEIRSE